MSIDEKALCQNCGQNPVMHRGSPDLCCKCHVANGNPPADWHPGCMKAYEAAKATDQPDLTLLPNGMIRANADYTPQAGEVWEVGGKDQPVEKPGVDTEALMRAFAADIVKTANEAIQFHTATR